MGLGVARTADSLRSSGVTSFSTGKPKVSDRGVVESDGGVAGDGLVGGKGLVGGDDIVEGKDGGAFSASFEGKPDSE